MEYALRLAKIEGLKAEERMKSGKADPCLNSDKGRTDEVIAQKLGIGGKDTYRKEKYIYENQSSLPPEDFADWDEGRLSILHKLTAEITVNLCILYKNQG